MFPRLRCVADRLVERGDREQYVAVRAPCIVESAREQREIEVAGHDDLSERHAVLFRGQMLVFDQRLASRAARAHELDARAVAVEHDLGWERATERVEG